jgi:hypothetical protein
VQYVIDEKECYGRKSLVMELLYRQRNRYAERKEAGMLHGVMDSIAWWSTLVVLALATFTDLHTRRIPNWLVAQ